MKKYVLAFVLCAALFSCHKGAETADATTETGEVSLPQDVTASDLSVAGTPADATAVEQ